MMSLGLDEIIVAIHGKTPNPLVSVRVNGVSTDSRTCVKGDLFFAIQGQRFDGHDYVDDALERGAVAAVVHRMTPGDRRPLIHVADTVAVLGMLGAFHRAQRSMPVIAVTGSNGKTTTQCMIDHVLRRHLRGRTAQKSFNNAIGVPLTLLSTRPDDEYLVVEIGSNAPGEIGALAELVSPTIAVVTSVGEAHLSGLGDIAGVAAEKFSILDHVRPGGLAVLNADIPGFGGLRLPRDGFSVVTFGTGDSADVRVTDVVTSVDRTEFRINQRFPICLQAPGRHNALNAAAAFTVCRRLGIAPEQIAEAMADFQLPSMRLTVERVGGLTLIDDCYNSNPTSMAAAIDVLRSCNGGRRVIVAGDMLELGDREASLHAEMGRQIADAGIEVVVGVGHCSEHVLAGASAGGRALTAWQYRDTQSACEELPKRIYPTDTVLVKGSRGMGLERLVQRLRSEFATSSEPTSVGDV